jgi:hypothetical protein
MAQNIPGPWRSKRTWASSLAHKGGLTRAFPSSRKWWVLKFNDSDVPTKYQCWTW